MTPVGWFAGLAAAFALVAGPGLAGAATQTTTIQTLHVDAAPGARATVPETISVSGQVGIPSVLAIYAQLGAPGCAAQAADEAARGATLVDRRTVSGSFAFSATFTPAAAGAYNICTYLDGSAPGTVEHQNQGSVLTVGPAPPPAPSTASPAGTPEPVPSGAPCVVPNLRRHTLRGAVHFLALANCKLGRVYRPSAAAVRAAKRRHGGHTPAQIVVSQTPAAASVKVGGYTVAVRLGFGRAPRTSVRHPAP